MRYAFTEAIQIILETDFGVAANEIFQRSQLLQYLNIKTKSANRSSKSRSSFGNIYAVYVLVEDYVSKGFEQSGNYTDSEGATFTTLFRRQRELPFGSKLQNHALNSRMNEEFKKYFPECEYIPIIRDGKTNRYWINENLLNISVNGVHYNLAATIVRIINRYIETKKGSFEAFIKTCQDLQSVQTEDQAEVRRFIVNLLSPTVDARIFEIISYAILKYYFYEQTVYFGFQLDKLNLENLKLFKTGRTNANDGGIDFVMKPLGRFFQVTETIDTRKYFLDIDKIERFPVTFVIKSSESVEVLKNRIKEAAIKQYSIRTVVDSYMSSVEEIINIQVLLARFEEAIKQGYLAAVLSEIIRQSKVEFNYIDNES